jgi:hypothetical protein
MLLSSLGALLVLASPAAAQVTALGAPATVDGPSADIQALSGVSVARDGTGGLIYIKSVAGVPHVFVSRLAGGSFEPPEELDASLLGASSQPVIAAGGGGQLVAAFINGGQLYVTNAKDSTTPFGAPAILFAGAGNPSLAMNSLDNKAYLAFTAVGAGGHDVRCAYFKAGQWAIEPTPLDAVAADDAGVGSGRPDVAAAGDGVGIVVWGEDGHVFARRVWGASPSTAVEGADVASLSGWSEASASSPEVATGGDSSYADVIFGEVLTNGSAKQSRVLMRRLHGGQFEDATAPDGLAMPGPEGANEPQVSMAEYGNGVATAALSQSNELFATLLGKNGAATSVGRLDSLPNATAPLAVSIAGGYYSDFVAWQHDPGALAAPEIRSRYYDGSNWGPEMVLSPPTLGPTDAAGGLFAGSDIAADVAVAWLQGTGAGKSIVTDQLYHAVGVFKVEASFQYARSANPVLSWTPPRERWGPTYTVTIDGAAVANTRSTSLRAPTLTEGAHSWSVTGVNGGGLQSSTKAATVFVDSVPPAVSFRVSGKYRARKPLHLRAKYTDIPAAGTRSQSSGIATVTVHWGDRTSDTIGHNKYHVYAAPGRYKVRVIATDKAGNSTAVVKTLRIRKAAVKKKKH